MRAFAGPGRSAGAFRGEIRPVRRDRGRRGGDGARPTQETRERIAFYASTPAYRPVLELHGWGELQTELNTLARKGEWKAMGDLIDDDVLHAFALVAPLDELPAAFGAWVGGLADRTSFTPPRAPAPSRPTRCWPRCAPRPAPISRHDPAGSRARPERYPP